MKIMKHVFLALFALTLILQPAAMLAMKGEKDKVDLTNIFAAVSELSLNGDSTLCNAEKTAAKTDLKEDVDSEKDLAIEKNEKKNPVKNEFRACPSLGHLTWILSTFVGTCSNIRLCPKPDNEEAQKTWFWNDGTLNEKSVYTVRYAGCKYTSAKSWDKQSMPASIYYNYLKERCTCEYEKEREKFLDYVIKKMVKYENETCKKVDVEICKKIILREISEIEEKQSGKYVFYHGRSGTRDFWCDFITLLHYYLDGSEDYRERTIFERTDCLGLEESKSLQEFFKQCPPTPSIGMYDWGLRDRLLSVNFVLFGNSRNCGSSSYARFCFSSAPGAPLETTLQLCGKKTEQNETPEDFKELFDGYKKKIKGRLEQIFIDADGANTYAYPSKAGGKRHGIFKDISAAVKQILVSPGSADELQARFINFSPLFLDPAVAKKHGLKIFTYYTSDKAAKAHKQLREKMDVLVRKNIDAVIEHNKILLTEAEREAMKKRLEQPYHELTGFKQAE